MAALPQMQAELVATKVKRVVIRNAGENGIRALSRALGIAEDDGTASVPRDELVRGLRAFGVPLSQQDCEVIFRYFDRNGDGRVIPTEFLSALRGGLSASRRALVQRAFASFDKDANMCVRLRDLRARFDASRHPLVVRGALAAEEVARRFAESFNDGTNPDGAITKQEFEQYCAGISATVEEDELFEALMRGCFGLPGCSGAQTAALCVCQPVKALRCGQDVAVQEEILRCANRLAAFTDLMRRHRAHLLKAPLGFRGVGRLLRQHDAEQLGFVPRRTFLDSLWANRVYIDEEWVLDELDTNRDGTVDYVLYLAHVLGELPPTRRLMLERLWRSFGTDRRGRVDIDSIHARYRAPDGDALNNFLAAWDKRLAAAVAGGAVCFDELVEWFVPMSERVSSDLTFEKLLNAQWMDGNVK